MEQPARPRNESARLKALRMYQLLDTLPEQDYDDITHIASEICHTPISLITLVDKDRQWFKSNRGLEVNETSREVSFCAHAIVQPDEVLIVQDAQQDVRFHDNPLVEDDPNIRFYAGVPLVNPEGFALGTLCVIDRKTRKLDPHQITALKALANQIVAQFELRRKNEELNQSQKALMEANQALEDFANDAAHDLKSPLNNIISLLGLLKRSLSPENTPKDVPKLIDHLDISAHRMKDMVDSILNFACLSEISVEEREMVKVKTLVDEVLELTTVPPHFNFQFSSLPEHIFTSRTALQHILSNLYTNAIKYNDKEEGCIKLTVTEDDAYYTFVLQDNGIGIEEGAISTIFDAFTTQGKKDRFKQLGTGLGLSIVKRLVGKLGGTVQVRSQLGVGTTFTFTVAKTIKQDCS